MDDVKLLGVIIDSKLTFYPHVKEMCKRANQKTRALARIRSCLSQTKTDILFNTFILSQFSYCPLVWMFCDKKSQRLITSTHRRALCIKHNDFSFHDSDYLFRTITVSIHRKNLILLAVEVYKAVNHIGPSIMWNTFHTNVSVYNLRRGMTVNITRVRNKLGLNSFDVRASQAWNYLPLAVTNAVTVDSFKTMISD